MSIKKGIIVFEFLYDDTRDSDAEVRGMTIDELLEDTDSGNMVGRGKPLEIVELKPDEVGPLLAAWNTDPNFFNEGKTDETL